MYRIGGQCGAVVLVLTLTLVTQLYRVQRSYHSQGVSRNQHTPSRCVIKLHIFGVFSCEEVVKYIYESYEVSQGDENSVRLIAIYLHKAIVKTIISHMTDW